MSSAFNPSDVLPGIINDAASAIERRNTGLNWHWLDVRNNIIDLVTRTIGLGLFTSIAVALLYIVISRKWRDGVTALILITVLPDCLSQFTVWLAVLSRLAQTYSLMRASILDIGVLAERISACANDPQCEKTMAYALWNSKPEYTANGCVGTALIASDRILHAAVICGAAVVFLLSAKRLGVVTGLLLFAPLVAACVSAVMHVKRVCRPDPIVVPGATFLRVSTSWEIFHPKGIDPTTTRLLQLTSAAALLLIVHYFWTNRGALKLFLKGGPKRGQFTYWVVVTFVLPMCVNRGWYSLRGAYRPGPNMPVLQYAFFSAGDALLVPLMVIYPGIAQLVQKIWKERNPESDPVIPAPEKCDALAAVDDAEKNEPVL
ncbi:hypothetical protein VTO73DRAFT_2885 [Trametes versicolor]